MPSIRYIKMAYAAASAYWMGRLLVALFSVPAAERNPNPMAAVYCIVVAGALPVLAGYFLLFKLIPRIGRSLRTS